MSLDKNSPDREILGRLGIIGHPWHGLCRNGVLTLPNGATKTYPQPSGGAAWVLRVPGTPAVSRTAEQLAADEAAGMQWLDYAIFSGDTTQIYSKLLGVGRWIYADSSGDRWLVTTTLHAATVAALESAGSITVTLDRFGVVGGAPESHVYVVTLPALGQDSPTLYNPNTGGGVLAKTAITARRFAVRHDGSRATFRLGVDISTLQRYTQSDVRPVGWVEVQIAGAGGSAVVSATVLKTRAATLPDRVSTDDLTSHALYQTVTETTRYEGALPYPDCGGVRIRETTTTTYEAELVGGVPPAPAADSALVLAWPTEDGVLPLIRGTQQETWEYVAAVAYDAVGDLEFTTVRHTVDIVRDTEQDLIVDAESYVEDAWIAGSGVCQAGDRLVSITRAFRLQYTSTTTRTLTVALLRDGVQFQSHTSAALTVVQAAEYSSTGTMPATTKTGPWDNNSIYADDARTGVGYIDAAPLPTAYALYAMEGPIRVGSQTGSGFLATYIAGVAYTPTVVGINRRRRLGETVISYTSRHEIDGQVLTDFTAYASRNPVSGTVSVDSVPVCWV